MGKTYRAGLPSWHFRRTMLLRDFQTANFREGVADMPSRAAMKHRRERRKVAERSFHTKPPVPARVHRRTAPR